MLKGKIVPKELCLALATAETEQEVVKILKENGFWDCEKCWEYYGQNENNYAIIGNQQSTPDAALVEKIINSVDAVLMRECLRKGINPESDEAPQSLKEALELFFKIPEGNISNLSQESRRKLAEDIYLVVTGETKKPNISIIDKGEGQSPEKMPDTFMSLNKSNKLRIPFVQGRFNMGSTGVLQFCGEHNLQLIISKRDPEIAKSEKKDPSITDWGFTIVRRFDPEGNMKHSTYKYLVGKDGKILRFKSDSLPLLPDNEDQAFIKPLKWGTFIKLYNYQLPSGLRSQARTHLWARLSALLPNIGLPALIYERRKYERSNYPRLLQGLSVSLDDSMENFEKGFPSDIVVNFNNNKLKITIYAFKVGKKKEYYINKEGILFTVNGQSHGFIDKRFFERKKVGMGYLADSLIVIVDCSDLNRRIQEKLFMNSRDRLRESPVKKQIERILEETLANHKGLKELKNRRRQEELKNKYNNKESLKDTLQKLAQQSPVLSSLLFAGKQITNPFDLRDVGTQENFEGKKFPTFFRLKKEFPENKPKACHLGSAFRIEFETDAENNYFNRQNMPGEFKINILNKELIFDYSIRLWNGVATLNVKLPSNLEIGMVLKFHSEVTDVSRVHPFINTFYVRILPPKPVNKGGNGKRKKPASDREGNERKLPSKLNMPEIFEVYKKEWDKHGFDQYSVLKVIINSPHGYDFYVNMDNSFLLSEIKTNSRTPPEIIKERYIALTVLVGLGILSKRQYNDQKNGENDSSENSDVYQQIFEISRSVVPMILPLILHPDIM